MRDQRRPLLVVSPHLDDAVLSVGQVLAGSPGGVVVTVFAGVPDGDVLAPYDRACGFTSSRQAMTQRRAEDERALRLLEARPGHLDFLAHDYGGPDRDGDEAVVAGLAAAIAEARPCAVLGPAGILHPDHERVARLWPLAARRAGAEAVYAYEELPYRVRSPRRAARVVADLEAVRGARRATLPAGEAGRKAWAMLAYVSQLRYVFPLDCMGPENVWALSEA